MISLKELAPTKRQGRVVTFGPYSDTAPYAFSPFSVHFENNNPFIRVTKLTRELEVSHWGNVYVDEKYYIRYIGLVYPVHEINLIHAKGRCVLSHNLIIIIIMQHVHFALEQCTGKLCACCITGPAGCVQQLCHVWCVMTMYAPGLSITKQTCVWQHEHLTSIAWASSALCTLVPPSKVAWHCPVLYTVPHICAVQQAWLLVG